MSSNLDRIQVVKGWLDTHQRAYDVVWSDVGSRRPGADGTLPRSGTPSTLKLL